MKTLLSAFFFLTASCTDVVHYISFSDKGQSLQVFRLTVQKSALAPSYKQSLDSMKAFRIRSSEYFISSSTVDTEIDTGFELLYTANEGYFSSEPAGIVPMKETFGFSFVLDPLLDSEEAIDDNARLWLDGAKYRILLSKNGLKPLKRVQLSAYGNNTKNLKVSEFDTFYLIEFPLVSWLFSPVETKISFYL